MKKTLQDQYLLIKEGKGHVGVFLAEAKREFPHIVRNAATFDEAVASLKTKNIISENVISVMPAMMDRPKKESYETAFEAFLAEAKKKNEDEKVKAEEKKVSKPVEEDLAHNYDNSDDKNPDNMIFDQIMMGYYAEMKDPKNADKTMQQLKDIVFKNLAKDPIHYTKKGQFGVKDLGYVVDAPGLGEPKEPKGKYKSSGYGDLKESKEAESEKESEEMIDLQSKLMQLGVNAMVVDAIARSKGIQGLRDRLKEKLKEGEEYYDGDDEEEVKDVRDMSWTKGFTKEEQTLREVVRKMIAEELEENYESLDYYTSVISSNDMSEEDAYAYLEDQGLNSRQIDSIIDQAFPDNMDEAYQLYNITPRKSDKERGEPSDPNPNPTAKIPAIIVDKLKRKGLTIEDGIVKMPKLLQMQIENKKIDFIKDLSLNKKTYPYYKALADSANYISTKDSNMFKFKKAIANEDGSITISLQSPQKEGVLGVRDNDVNYNPPLPLPVSYSDDKNVAHYSDDDRYSSQEDRLDPEDYFEQIQGMSDGDAFDYLGGLGLERDEILTVLKSRKSSLRESVEKDLADINKEAEHEVLQAKLAKIDDLIDHKRSKLSKLDEDEDMKALTDKKKVKELEKDIKKLEVARKKVEKIMSKFKGKKAASKEVIDETEGEDELPLETPAEASAEYKLVQKDAERRYDEGESIDSIMSNYPNLSDEDQETLYQDLEGKMNGMDY
jgi:hypothetical protein